MGSVQSHILISIQLDNALIARSEVNMPCYQKIAEKVPEKCPKCGNKVVDSHCFACQGTGNISKEQEKVIYQ